MSRKLLSADIDIFKSKQNLMFQILLIISAVIGAILVVLSRAQNLLLFFGGIGTLFASLIVFLIKRHARTVFIPFILLLWASLFILNSWDFRANVLNMDYTNPEPYAVRVYVGESPSLPGALLPGFSTDLDTIRIEFRKSPSFNPIDFILADYQSENNQMNALWSWTDEQRWIKMSTADYLHIYDPLINVYYPDEVTALLLVDRLEFSLIDFPPGSDPKTTKLSTNDLYYSLPAKNLSFNSPLHQLIIKRGDNTSTPRYEVWANDVKLQGQSSSEGWYFFTFNDSVYRIDKLEVIEKAQPAPTSIDALEPTFSEIYLIEEEPAPIIFRNITLEKLFARLNFSIPIYGWDSKAIQAEFTPMGGTLMLENGVVQVIPKSIQTFLILNRSIGPLIEQGIAMLAPYVLWANIITTVLSLLLLIIFSLFLNHNDENIKLVIGKCINWIKKVVARRPARLKLQKLTPFTLFFYFFLISVWVLLLSSPINTYVSLTIFILSICSAYYVIKEHQVLK